jgi:hypothetical protein
MKGLQKEEEAEVPSTPDVNTSYSPMDPDPHEELKRLWHESRYLVNDDKEMKLVSRGASSGNIHPTPSQLRKTCAVGGDLSPW